MPVGQPAGETGLNKNRFSFFRRNDTIQDMPVAWPIAKVLFKLIAPSIPDIVSTISTLKHQQAEPQTREEPLQARIAEIEQRLTQQLELIEKLTKQIDALQSILWRTLLIGLAALGLALTGLALIFYA